MNRESPHVGVTYSSHGAARVPADDHHWWWRQSYPWWAYQIAQPWYGMQSQCYFDPSLFAWVCPESPWAYQPIYQRWYQPRAIFALR